MSLLVSVVRVHLAERNDPFCHTWPIGRRLSMAGLEQTSQSLGAMAGAVWLFTKNIMAVQKINQQIKS